MRNYKYPWLGQGRRKEEKKMKADYGDIYFLLWFSIAFFIIALAACVYIETLELEPRTRTLNDTKIQEHAGGRILNEI